jgi:hypothetical protein
MRPQCSSEAIGGSGLPVVDPSLLDASTVSSTGLTTFSAYSKPVPFFHRDSLYRNVGIALLFDANFGGRTVTRKDGDVVIEGPELFTDPAEEKVMIAARQVSAADAASEEDVSTIEKVGRLLQEADVTGAVSWDVENLEVDSLDHSGRGFLGKEVRLNGLDFPIKAELFEEVGLGDESGRVGVITDFASVIALDAGGIPNVVDVAVGQEESFHVVTLGLKPFGGVLRRIDQNAGFEQKEAVRVKDAARENV